jgi:hypothetical protein
MGFVLFPISTRNTHEPLRWIYVLISNGVDARVCLLWACDANAVTWRFPEEAEISSTLVFCLDRARYAGRCKSALVLPGEVLAMTR